MPVMEGKAMLFKEFAGVDAFPICLDTRDPDEIVEVVHAIGPGFGGVNLEDISAPRCFEIEDRLIDLLDIPVFHDDQHGTAVVVLAALLNALKLTGRRIEDLRTVIVGLGAAGVAVTRILVEAGASHVVGVDLPGALSIDRPGYLDGSMHPVVARAGRGHEPRAEVRWAVGGPGGRGPVHRRVRPRGTGRFRPGPHEPRPDRVRHGQPGSRDLPRGGGSLCPDRGHRAVRLVR